MSAAQERVRQSPELAWVESEDRVVLVRLDDLAAEPLVLSGSAAVIWAAVAEPLALDELVARVAAAYGRPEAEVADEVAGFVESCRQLGIMR